MQKTFHVYIMSSRSKNLYTGVTSQLVVRVWKHKTKELGGHTVRYNIDRLVCFEEHATAEEAIAREKEIKSWRRELRVELIESVNPGWYDLSEGWYDTEILAQRPTSNADPYGMTNSGIDVNRKHMWGGGQETER